MNTSLSLVKYNFRSMFYWIWGQENITVFSFLNESFYKMYMNISNFVSGADSNQGSKLVWHDIFKLKGLEPSNIVFKINSRNFDFYLWLTSWAGVKYTTNSATKQSLGKLISFASMSISEPALIIHHLARDPFTPPCPVPGCLPIYRVMVQSREK